MIRIIRNILIFTLIIPVLSGCGTIRSGGAPDLSFDINTDLQQLSQEFQSSTNISNFYKTPTQDRLDARNRFIIGRLVQIDLRYLQYIKNLTSDKQQLDSATDMANLALNLAGTLVGSARAKTNLAASAAGLIGMTTIIDKNFYYEKSIDALVATMNAKRKEVLVTILTGLSTKTLDDYPFERAITDINQYYLAGTLNGAIQFINVQAATNEDQSNKKIDVLYNLVIPTGQQISDIKTLTDSLGEKSLTLAKANAALKGIGMADGDLPKFLDGPMGGRQLLKDKIRHAKNIPDETSRNAEIKKITDAFKAAAMLN